MLTLIIFIIFVALVFDFLNGFHDAANSIATIVSTRVLTPSRRSCGRRFFNFVAAFLFGTNVAGTIGKGLDSRDPNMSTCSSCWRVDRRDRLEHDHLAARAADQLVARAVSGAAGAAIAKGGFGAIIVGKSGR
jgi:PiT family inorganic phosphate transporter